MNALRRCTASRAFFASDVKKPLVGILSPMVPYRRRSPLATAAASRASTTESPPTLPPSTPPAMTGGVTEDDLRAKLRPVFDKVCDRTRRLPIRSYPDPK